MANSSGVLLYNELYIIYYNNITYTHAHTYVDYRVYMETTTQPRYRVRHAVIGEYKRFIYFRKQFLPRPGAYYTCTTKQRFTTTFYYNIVRSCIFCTCVYRIDLDGLCVAPTRIRNTLYKIHVVLCVCYSCCRCTRAQELTRSGIWHCVRPRLLVYFTPSLRVYTYSTPLGESYCQSPPDDIVKKTMKKSVPIYLCTHTHTQHMHAYISSLFFSVHAVDMSLSPSVPPPSVTWYPPTIHVLKYNISATKKVHLLHDVEYTLIAYISIYNFSIFADCAQQLVSHVDTSTHTQHTCQNIGGYRVLYIIWYS